MSEASNLPDANDRSALRSLPISPTALFGPQVKLSVERWAKNDFDDTVKDCMKSKARSESKKPFKRPRTDSKPPRPQNLASDSFANSHPKKSYGNKNQTSYRGKPKPKGSAHPQ